MRKGSILLIFSVVIFILSCLILLYILGARNYLNFQSETKKGGYPSVNVSNYTEEERLESVEIDTKLNQYKDRKMIQVGITGMVNGWGFWNVTEYELFAKDIHLDPCCKTQAVNGLKNFTIILNKTRSFEKGSTKPYLYVSNKFAQIFANLITNANSKLEKDNLFSTFPKHEQAAYLLANPAANIDVLKDKKYLNYFEIVKMYSIDQNQSFVNEVKSICDHASHKRVRNYCYFSIASSFVDNFECSLIDANDFGVRDICYRIVAIEKQDKGLCKYSGSQKDYCERSLNHLESN